MIYVYILYIYDLVCYSGQYILLCMAKVWFRVVCSGVITMMVTVGTAILKLMYTACVNIIYNILIRNKN